MDGDGSIQVNHWRKKNLQFRLVIKLKLDQENLGMLNIIKIFIGGRVRITKDKFVIWVVDNKKEIIEIINIFEKYPPLTIRLNAQLLFLKNCLEHNNINTYLSERNNKYINKNIIISKYNCSYFKEWLSGFIEAEGCFCIRKNGDLSFTIAQKNEELLIYYIKEYLEIKSKIRLIKNNIYLIETYRRSTLFNLIKHFEEFPLLGQKLISYNKFKKFIINL